MKSKPSVSKRVKSKSLRSKEKPIALKNAIDEEISSEEEDLAYESPSEDEAENYEFAEQKRARLAKEYLASMKGSVQDDNEDDSDIDHDVSERLQIERLESQGKYFRSVSDNIESLDEHEAPSRLAGHKASITALSVSRDDTFIISCSKDNSVIHWDTETGKKSIIKSEWRPSNEYTSFQGEILSSALSSDDKYLVCGGRDKKIRLFDLRTSQKEINVFEGHRDSVSCLAFRQDGLSLFSGSYDRTIKYWDISQMGYIETLFGHQDAVISLDCFNKDRPVSSSFDRTVRTWNVKDGTHSIFRGSKSSIDNVRYISSDTFVSGSQDGSLSLFKSTQKRPIANFASSHGFEATSAQLPHWVTSISALKMSDLCASGSYDGFLRLWKVDADDRSIEHLKALPCPGFVNSLHISSKIIVAGLGNEHRLGRWWSLKGVKNNILVYKLPESQQ